MKNLRLNLPVALLLLALLFVVFVRIRLLATPLERDEGEFAYAGQLMLQGIPPYKLFYNMKFPGIYAAYALLMFLFGESAAGIHFGLLLVNVAGILLLYRLARRFLNVPGAVAAAASYAFLSTSPVVFGLAAHATHFVVAAALAGLLLLLRGEDSGKPVLFFCSGFLFGIACLMKQPGAFFGLFGFCLLVARGAREREQWCVHCRRIALFSIGLAAPLAITAAILWQAGVFKRFWFWTIVYARTHATMIPWSIGRLNLAAFFQLLPFRADGLFWMSAVLGMASLALARGEQRKKFWMAGFLVFSGMAVSLSNFFSAHYFVMLLPALCLFAGQAVSAAMQWARAGKPGSAWAALPAGLFIFMWTLAVFHHRAIFFVLSPDQACKKIYAGNPFVECVQIGNYIREHSAPGARIAVLGSEPEILFEARRHSATGYIYMYDLIQGPERYAGEMQREMIAQIEDARPEYLVFVSAPVSWDMGIDFPRADDTAVVTWFFKFVKDFYEPDGLVILKPDSEYYWGRDALNHPPFDGPFISIFKRK
jgi:4-amino-4-deoxy-L-arabinose transferase-like glycosyltransferase